MQKILRYAYDIVFFTTYRYVSFIKAVKVAQTISLNGNSASHILAGLEKIGHEVEVIQCPIRLVKITADRRKSLRTSFQLTEAQSLCNLAQVAQFISRIQKCFRRICT